MLLKANDTNIQYERSDSMNDNPLMIMLVNLSIVFAVLMILWAIIALTGKIADQISSEE